MKKSESSKPQVEGARQEQVQNFLRRPQVCEITGLKTSTLYEMMQAGTFPRPIRISKRLVVWPESEVAAWQSARIAGART
ncbi:MAG TPA: AlpA family phage regulatory protein [Rhizomicrobium sp.]|nr:AlpA family phage regulatory protein [Rhizomicrobium sp.]